MAIESIGSVSGSGLSPYIRETAVQKSEPVVPENANATTQTHQAVAPVQSGNSGATAGGTTREDLEEALKKVNEFVSNRNTDLQFSTDDETGLSIVKVIDRSSKEVIRQIPSEEMVQFAKVLDKLQGLLIRQQA